MDVLLAVNNSVEAHTAAVDTSHELLVAKIVSIVVLLIITVICGSLPYMANRCFKWTKKDPEVTRSSVVIRSLLYFGGGVLLCTTFLHMLPDVIEVVEQLQRCQILANTPFALAEMLMCTGFFIMFMLDEIMHTFVHRHQKKLSRKESLATAAFERGHSVRNSVLLVHCSDRPRSTREPPNVNCFAIEVNQKKNNEPPHIHSDYEVAQVNGHSHMPVVANNNSVSSSMRGLGIILALSLHELFEGMAIGLQDTVSTVWFMFAAVAAHKLVLAFCVGMELLVARTRTALAVTYLITFAVVTPIGIGIGIAVSQQADAKKPSVPSGILQGIAAGTLLYVVFFEILTQNHSGWRTYIASMLGFGLMFGLQILSDEAEGADDTSC